MTKKDTETNPPGFVRATATGLLTGAIAGLIAALASVPLRRIGDVTDRSYLNGVSIVLLAIVLWTAGGAAFVLWERRGEESVAAVTAVALAIAAILSLYVWLNQGPLTPYPTHFASLAVPTFFIIAIVGALLYRRLIALPSPRLRYAAPGGFIVAAAVAAIVAGADRASAVKYTLSKPHTTTAARVTTTATSEPSGPVAAVQQQGAASPGVRSSTPAAAPAAAGTPAGPLHFTVSSQSEASFTVREKLARLPSPSDAIGKTSAITGDLYLLPTGLAPNPASVFSVDLRTLTSDAPPRDRYIKGMTLETQTYPMATYTITSVEGFPATYTDGDEVKLTLNGTFSVHGVQKPLTWTGTARLQDKQLEAVMTTSFDMHDFNITPPSVSVAVAESGVKLDLHLFATEQGS